MNFLYFVNVAILTFNIVVIAGVIKRFSQYPYFFNVGLAAVFIILILGLAPYRIRVKNPLAWEFLVIFVSSIMGVVLWF